MFLMYGFENVMMNIYIGDSLIKIDMAWQGIAGRRGF